MTRPREWPDVRDALNECPHLEQAQVICCAACLDAALNRAFAAGRRDIHADTARDRLPPDDDPLGSVTRE